MNTDSRREAPISYPFVSMNHLAMMLFMLKHRLFFPKQAETILGAPVRVLSVAHSPDNTHPLAAYHFSRDTVMSIDI